MNKQEHTHSINGVPGRMFARRAWPATDPKVPERSRGLWSSQTWGASRYRGNQRLSVKMRFDDNCKNGHNDFAITATLYEDGRDVAGGCMHDAIAEWFPELAPLIRWHLTSTGGPMHYIANTLYWVGKKGYVDGKPDSPPNLDRARSTAVWPDATEAELGDESALRARLPALIAVFRADMESCGFAWEVVP